LFANPTNSDFSLKSGASNPALGFATQIIGHTTGLDSSTNWGINSAISNVVTKENTSLCAGSYVQ
jgi:hypothetical protein